jgi:predicted N-acetyltransferase YhbS
MERKNKMSELKLEKLKKENFAELVGFIDEVFTEQNGKKMDFLKAFPRIFKENDENMGWYEGVFEDGELLGTAGSHPFNFRVLDRTLKVAQIGNVAVSSKCRGRGFMQMIMKSLCGKMEDEGYDMSYLHGERKRYRTFGYERCAAEYVLTMTPSLPNALGLKGEFTFIDMRENFEPYKDEVIAIARGKMHNFEREEDEYYDSLIAHEAIPLLIKDNSGNTVGYLSYSKDSNMVIEIGLKRASDFVGVTVSLLEYLKLQSFVITFAEYESELIGEAMKICRHCQIIQSGNFKIINFDKVTEAFMAAKATYAPLLDGELVLDTELFGKWMIAVKDGKCSVTRTDRAADVYVDGYKVYPFVFGPMSPFTVGVDLSRVSPEAKRLINSWFPVPLYCDNVS